MQLHKFNKKCVNLLYIAIMCSLNWFFSEAVCTICLYLELYLARVVASQLIFRRKAPVSPPFI